MTVYADNAATTKMSRESIKAMLKYTDEIYANPSSLHSAGQRAAECLEAARAQIAELINAEKSEIYFTSGGSEADNQALVSAAYYGAKKEKKHIISTQFEHHAVLHTLKKLEKEGFSVTLLPVYENGIVRPVDVENAIREDTCLVSVMFANNEIGTIQPIAEIGDICRRKKVLFHTDAVQAAGHIKIDVKNMNIDMLSASAHKFGGPKGVGFLYAAGGVKLTRLIEGGAQERGKRAGTENIAGIAAMAAALNEACAGMDLNAQKLIGIRNYIIDGLLKIPHSILNGDKNNRLPGNINVCFEGIEGEALLLLLDDKGIYASSGSACTSGSLEPSHVLLSIGRPHEIAHGSLRLTLSEENTPKQAEYIVKTVTEVTEKLRGLSPIWRDKKSGKREYIIK